MQQCMAQPLHSRKKHSSLHWEGPPGRLQTSVWRLSRHGAAKFFATSSPPHGCASAGQDRLEGRMPGMHGSAVERSRHLPLDPAYPIQRKELRGTQPLTSQHSLLIREGPGAVADAVKVQAGC